MKMTNFNKLDLFGEDYDAVHTIITPPPPIKLLTSKGIFNKYDMLNIIKQLELLKPINSKKQIQNEISSEALTQVPTDDTNIDFDIDFNSDCDDDDFIMTEITPTIPLELANINETYDLPQRVDYNFDKTKFQIVNVFKIIWLKNITKNGGAQQQLLDQIQPNEIIIKSVTKNTGRYGR